MILALLLLGFVWAAQPSSEADYDRVERDAGSGGRGGGKGK